LLASSARVIELPVNAHASTTFHGRDVFAPAAVALARGETFDAIGVEAQSPIVRRTPEPIRRVDGALDGEVIIVDRFGNAVTNLVGMRGGTVEVGAVRIAVRRTYAEVDPGELVAVVGSTGFIEIAARDGNAAAMLNLSRGSPVSLTTAHVLLKERSD
jgi:S-adenosylmethionine hydrolase